MRSSFQGTMKVIPKQTKTKCPFQGSPGGSVVRSPPTNEETWFQSLGREDPICRKVAGLVCHNYLSLRSRACVPQLLSSCTTATEACTPRARAPQQEKPPQWDACAPWLEWPPLAIIREKPTQQWRPSTAKNKFKNSLKKYTFHIVMGWTVPLPNSYVEPLTPSTSECSG